MELHDILGVSPEADEKAVAKAYRARAKKLHPDQGGDPEEFKRVTGAYLVLRDPARRAHYERTGQTESNGVDSIRESALQIIGAAIQQSLLDDRAATYDIAKTMRDNLKRESTQLAQAAKMHRDNKAKAERNAKRWKPKDASADIVASMAVSVIRECEKLASECERQIEIRAAASEILDGYEYEFTAPKADPHQNPRLTAWIDIGGYR